MQTAPSRPTDSEACRLLETLLDALRGCDIIDLSQDIVSSRSDGPFRTRMEILDARSGARFLTEELMPRYFPEAVGKIRPESFPDGAFLRHETVTASTHAGSHVDAPGHYGGPLERGSLVVDAPVRCFIAEGVLFDCASSQSNEITWQEIELIMIRHGIECLAGKIPLIRTGGCKAVAPQTIQELLDRGVQVIGTDNDSLDGPFRRMLETYLATGDKCCLWPCHMLGRHQPYYQLENLTHLDELPVQGFLLWAPPILVQGATAAWSRVLALRPREGGR